MLFKFTPHKKELPPRTFRNGTIIDSVSFNPDQFDDPNLFNRFSEDNSNQQKGTIRRRGTMRIVSNTIEVENTNRKKHQGVTIYEPGDTILTFESSQIQKGLDIKFNGVEGTLVPVTGRRNVLVGSAIVATLGIGGLVYLMNRSTDTTPKTTLNFDVSPTTASPEIKGTSHNKLIPVDNIDQRKSPEGKLYIYKRTEVIDVQKDDTYILSISQDENQIGGFFADLNAANEFINGHSPNTSIPLYENSTYQEDPMYPKPPKEKTGEILVVTQDSISASIFHVLRSIDGKPIKADCRVVKPEEDVESVLAYLRNPPSTDIAITQLNLKNVEPTRVRSSDPSYKFTLGTSDTFL